MLSAYMERRTAQRVTLETTMAIIFRKNERELTEGYALDISIGGLKFMAPQGSLPLVNGENVTFIFDLPGYGLIEASGKVSYLGCLSDQGQGIMTIFGAKFNELLMDSWNKIFEYCQGFVTVEAQPICVAKSEISAIRESTQPILPASLRLKDGRSYLGRLKDISFGGARVLLSEPLNLKDSVVLELTFQKKRMRLRASCVWCFPFDETNELHLAGIYFSNLNSDEFFELKQLIAGFDTLND